MTVRTAGGGDGWCIVSGVRCLAGETLPRLVRTGAAGTRMLLLLHNRPDTWTPGTSTVREGWEYGKCF